MENSSIKKTRSQKIGDIGHVEIDRIFKRSGWTVTTIPGGEDYGEDQMVKVFINGEATELIFFVQVKAKENPKRLKTFNGYSLSIETSKLDIWLGFTSPVFLILWDEKNKQAYWVEIHKYFREIQGVGKSWRGKKSSAVRIPGENKLDSDGIIRINTFIREWHHELIHHIRGENFEIPIKFQFTKDEEGKNALTDFQKHFQTGSPVEIPSKYIKEIDFPSWFKRIYDVSNFHIDGVFRVEPIIGKDKIPHKIEFHLNSGEVIRFEYIELRVQKKGTDEITISNEQQNYFLNVIITSNKTTKKFDVKFKYSFSDIGFEETTKLHKAFNGLSEGCKLVITNLHSQEKIVDQYIKINIPRIPNETILILEKARWIEEKINIKLNISIDKISLKDVQNINELHCILNEGKVTKKFSTLPVALKKEDWENILSNIGIPQPNHFKFFIDEVTYNILGEEIYLGKMEQFFPSVVIKGGLDELKEKVISSQEELIEVEFIPGSTNEFEEIYPDYLSI